VEQLGAVYERLLDVDPAEFDGLAPTPVRRADPGSGRHSPRRKETGTFYTPQPLADFVVRRTLAPLVADASPDDILALRVVDPSMGSGAFLVSACRYLAGAYTEALVRDGHADADDLDDDERARIRPEENRCPS
jgi:type I restriction-modification system DNA methylase subunit